MLPDLTDSHWEAKGQQAVPQGLHKDALANTFLWALEEDRGYGLIKANYTFYVSKVGWAAVPACTALYRHVLHLASVSLQEEAASSLTAAAVWQQRACRRNCCCC